MKAELCDNSEDYRDLEVYWTDGKYDYISRASLDYENGAIFRHHVKAVNPYGTFDEEVTPTLPLEVEAALVEAEAELKRYSETQNQNRDSASVLDRNKWEDNSIQFPRLLCEIVATQNVDIPALCESMDLEPLDITAIFERAHNDWEAIKAAG